VFPEKLHLGWSKPARWWAHRLVELYVALNTRVIPSFCKGPREAVTASSASLICWESTGGVKYRIGVNKSQGVSATNLDITPGQDAPRSAAFRPNRPLLLVTWKQASGLRFAEWISKPSANLSIYVGHGLAFYDRNTLD
jgi:hypothetical protein